MKRFLERSFDRLRHYCWRNLLLAHLVESDERDARWPDWAQPYDPAGTRTLSEDNRPGAVLGEALMLLAATASIYILIAFLIGIATRNP